MYVISIESIDDVALFGNAFCVMLSFAVVYYERESYIYEDITIIIRLQMINLFTYKMYSDYMSQNT